MKRFRVTAATTSTLATALTVFVPSAMASEWRVEPAVTVSATYTDNVSLLPKGSEQDDFVTVIAPSIAMKEKSNRLNAEVHYTMQNLFHANAKRSDPVSHQLRAEARGEVLSNFLYFDSKAEISQFSTTVFAPITDNAIYLNSNRADVRTFKASPYLRHRLGRLASTELRYAREWISSSDDNMAVDYHDEWSAIVNSGPRFERFQWQLSLQSKEVNYENGQSYALRSDVVNLRYNLHPRLQLTGTLGYEENDYSSLANTSHGNIYLAGLVWSPDQRTVVEAQAGQRYFGNAYELTATHRMRTASFSVKYSEDVTTTLSGLPTTGSVSLAELLSSLWESSIPDPRERAQFIQDYLLESGISANAMHNVQLLTNRVYLEKGWTAAAALRGLRNTFITSLSHTDRQAQMSRTFDAQLSTASMAGLEDSTRQTGIGFQWNRKVSARTAMNTSLSYLRAKSLIKARQDNHVLASLSLTYLFNKKSRGTLEVRRRAQNSSASSEDRRENAVSVSFFKAF